MQKNLKILLVSNGYPSKTDNVYGIFVKNFEESLKKQGLDFSLKAVIRGKSSSTFEKVIKYIKLYLEIIWLVLFKKPDLVYVHYPSQVAPVLWLLTPFLNNKLILNFHGNDLINMLGVERFLFPIVKILAKHAALVVVPSLYFKNIAKIKLSIGDEKVCCYASGGVNSAVFYPPNNFKAAQNTDIKIGFVSRIEEDKGWDDFLTAMHVLKQKASFPFSLVVVGGGVEEEKFHALAGTLQLKPCLKFYRNLSQEELRGVYHSLDLFIFPTRRTAESLGLVGLEAMACGVPVVGSKIGGITTYLKEGVNGWFVNPGSPTEIVEKVIYFESLSIHDKLMLKQDTIESVAGYDSNLQAKMLADRLRELVS
ncbi:MAG: glycosyltransferase [Luteibaculaceae bacterium]